MERKTIGQLNGWWAWLLKLVLVLVPIGIAGQSWLVVEVLSIKYSRFTREMATDMQKHDEEIHNDLLGQITKNRSEILNLPPRDLLERVTRNEERSMRILEAIVELKSEIRSLRTEIVK